jgi:hypothetical protein
LGVKSGNSERSIGIRQAIRRCRPLEGRQVLILRTEPQEEPDQAHEERAVQPPNRSQRTTPPEESGARYGSHAGERMETLHVILLMIDPLYRAGDPSVCSILHIFVGKEETKVGGGSELLRLALWSRWVF